MRYPGHADRMKFLPDAGVFGDTDVQVTSGPVRPRDVAEALLYETWPFGEGDPDLTGGGARRGRSGDGGSTAPPPPRGGAGLNRLRIPVTCLLLAAMPMSHGGAQVVEGRVLEVGGARPVVLATVALADTAYEVVEQTLTDHRGGFQLRAPAPGDYYVLVERLGYEPSIDGVLELGEGGFIEVTFYVRPRAIELEGITATAEGRRIERTLERAGFYDRLNAGFGDFVTPEDLEGRPLFDAGDLLRGIPGVRTVGSIGGDGILCNGSEPRVFVNGFQVAFPALRGSGGSNVVLEAVAGVNDIVGVEVYRRASSLPLQYGGAFDGASGGRCTILVWTKG